MSSIHPTAIIDPGARLGDGVSIGPYCVVGGAVELGPGVELISHVAVAGITSIGARTRVFPFASIGHQPQDKKYRGEPSRLIIGADNVIRESVSINPGTEDGGMLTLIGDRNLFMLGSHVAHDCRVGNDIVFSNNATLAGHVTVEDFVILGGLSAVHQYCRLGRYAFIGGMTGVERDVIPYGMVMGDRARMVGINLRGLQRNGFDKEAIQAIRGAYRLLFGPEGTLLERVALLAERHADNRAIMEIVDFIRADSSRAIVQPAADAD